MATVRRRSTATVEERVFREPDRFDVFQLVRLLRVRDSSRPDAAAALKRRLRWRLMSGDADTRSFVRFAGRLRFRADLSPAFPGREVTACLHVAAEAADGGLGVGVSLQRSRFPIGVGSAGVHVDRPGSVELRTPNYCVASELGPLPEPFLEWVRERLREEDGTFAAFLDLFNHRINVLRHQLKATQDMALDYALPQDTLLADYLASVAGIASPDAEAQLALPRRAWLGMAATLADPRRAAAPALAALRQYLGAPRARLVPLVGTWQTRPSARWTALGATAALGGDLVLGTRVWNQMAGVYLRVPDVDYGKLCALLPPPWRSVDAVSGQNGSDLPDVGDNEGMTARHDEEAGGTQGHHGIEENAPARRDAAAPDNTAAVDGYRGLAQMIRLLFDRRVECTVALTTRAERLPPSLLTATPGRGETASSSPRFAQALPHGVDYRGLRLGQTAWLAGAGGTAGGMRHVRFIVSPDPAEVSA